MPPNAPHIYTTVSRNTPRGQLAVKEFLTKQRLLTWREDRRMTAGFNSIIQVGRHHLND
jgi:hypothetical protein